MFPPLEVLGGKLALAKKQSKRVQGMKDCFHELLGDYYRFPRSRVVVFKMYFWKQSENKSESNRYLNDLFKPASSPIFDHEPKFREP
jgi:hypothetical protein